MESTLYLVVFVCRISLRTDSTHIKKVDSYNYILQLFPQL